MVMDETLYAVQGKVVNYAVMYLVDVTKVPDFNKVSGIEGLGGAVREKLGGAAG